MQRKGECSHAETDLISLPGYFPAPTGFTAAGLPPNRPPFVEFLQRVARNYKTRSPKRLAARSNQLVY
jgi:hypothetical protein